MGTGINRVRWLQTGLNHALMQIAADVPGLRRAMRSMVGNLPPKARVLDIGCGHGDFISMFPDAKLAVGFDIDAGCVAYARRRVSSKNLAVMDAVATGWPSDFFDWALIIGVLHHLDDGQARAALTEARRVLRVDGSLLVIEPIPATGVTSLYHRAIRSLDRGKFLRSPERNLRLIGEHFDVNRSTTMVVGGLYYWWVVGRRYGRF